MDHEYEQQLAVASPNQLRLLLIHLDDDPLPAEVVEILRRHDLGLIGPAGFHVGPGNGFAMTSELRRYLVDQYR